MKYCTLCERYVDPVKPKWSWLHFFLGLGILGYVPYRIFFVERIVVLSVIQKD